jgi:two-component sensor histidine kinase
MADEVESALKYKDVLLRELNHRIMNSLYSISALMRHQARSVQEPGAARLLEQAVTRIDGIALAYRRMQAVRGVETIEFAPFLEELCREISSSLMAPSTTCAVRADPLSLSPERAISLSLVVNELLTNAIKHGTPGAPVAVTLDYRPGQCRLAVRSRGSLPADYNVEQERGFGTKMVSLVAAQLRGTLSVNQDEGEVEFAITFPPEPRAGEPDADSAAAPQTQLTLDVPVP